MTNPYRQFVKDMAQGLLKAKRLPLGGFAAVSRPALPKQAPKVLLFSPHPDDECITGALPLRLLREAKMHVVNVAVTLGSRKDRQAERLEELKRACGFIGFDLVVAGERGLERINLKTRKDDPSSWAASVKVVAEIIGLQKPAIVVMPHDQDWNTTHIGTHHLVMEALAAQGKSFRCNLVETEFWAPMSDPNAMIESSVADVADLVAATSFHVGEVRRNPYHLRLPAWLQDNVRRGGELVGGQGAEPRDFMFATLYRLSRWSNGARVPLGSGGRMISCNESLISLFG